ncbi:MAG: YitT family protein [Firmicutes bacterium]|nr:YitT family protein [Bacillota bacterium]
MKKLSNFAALNAGVFMVAFGIHVFRNPNGFATGGVSGLSLLLYSALPFIPMGAIMLALNLAILALGYALLGKEKAAASAYGTIALSAMVWLMELAWPIARPLTNQKFLELVFSVLIPGVGSSLVFKAGATTGGTDIVAFIIKKYSSMKITTAMLAADFFIASAAIFIFGVEAGLYSILGVCMRSFLMDSIMESLHIYKIMVIISERNAEIKEFINLRLDRGATVHRAYGAYTKDEKEVITTVLNRRQAAVLQKFIKDVDPKAFITISNSTEIIGNRFGGFE